MGTANPTRTGGRFDPWLPDLTPKEARRRLALIKTAQADPAATWTVRDVMFVADVEWQTVRAWPNRGIDFPKPVGETREGGNTFGRPHKVFNAGQVLRWLISTERLIPGTWMCAIPRAGTLHTPTARRGPLQLPGALARALKATLGLEQGKARDFIVRSTVDAGGVRHWSLIFGDEGEARRVVEEAASVEKATAAHGHQVRIGRVARSARAGTCTVTVEPATAGSRAATAA